MKLPHGIHDFEKLVKKRFYYIDRTPYIEKLERSKDRFVLFRRPQGFDRKLFISMLGYYYGIQYRNKFEALFKNYYIYRNKTSQANSYHIMSFDLCDLDLTSPQQTEQSLTRSVRTGLEVFLHQYGGIRADDQNYLLLSDRVDELLSTILNDWSAGNIYLFIDDAWGLISEIAVPGTGYSSYNPISRSLMTRFYGILRRAMSEGNIARIMSLGIDESDDRI